MFTQPPNHGRMIHNSSQDVRQKRRDDGISGNPKQATEVTFRTVLKMPGLQISFCHVFFSEMLIAEMAGIVLFLPGVPGFVPPDPFMTR